MGNFEDGMLIVSEKNRIKLLKKATTRFEEFLARPYEGAPLAVDEISVSGRDVSITCFEITMRARARIVMTSMMTAEYMFVVNDDYQQHRVVALYLRPDGVLALDPSFEDTLGDIHDEHNLKERIAHVLSLALFRSTALIPANTGVFPLSR